MPNSLQLVFVGSFLATSAALFTFHSWAISALRNAGYDPANIILIGLPGHEVYFMDNFKDTLRTVLPNTVDVPGVGAVNVVDFVASPAVLVASVVVFVTAVYVKLFHTGAFCSFCGFCAQLTSSQAEPSPLTRLLGKSSRCSRRFKCRPTQPCAFHFCWRFSCSQSQLPFQAPPPTRRPRSPHRPAH